MLTEKMDYKLWYRLHVTELQDVIVQEVRKSQVKISQVCV